MLVGSVEMSNQQKPPEFSELFLLFPRLVTSLLQAEGPQWRPCGMLWARSVVTGTAPWWGVGGPVWGWTGLETSVLPPRAAGCCRHLCVSLHSCPGAHGLCTPLHAGPERAGSSVRAEIRISRNSVPSHQPLALSLSCCHHQLPQLATGTWDKWVKGPESPAL